MKKHISLVVATCMILSMMLYGCNQQPATTETTAQPTTQAAVVETTAPQVPAEKEFLTRQDWEPGVKKALNDLMNTYGNNGEYAVFDFDNTCSIFDVEEQLAIYQLQTMTFAITPQEMPTVLATELSGLDKDLTDLGYGKGSYNDWISDITAAYTNLYATYGPFTAQGLDEATQEKIQQDDNWKEFATKMRAMYDLVYDNESADVAYPWILYWFTNMTEEEVYQLAYKSHSKYKALETSLVNWESPEVTPTKTGKVTYEWTSGTQVSENIKELWKGLKEAGIDVWVCSASHTDVIRAGIDVWGLHDYCTGLTAMTNKLVDGKYINQYDYETGVAWHAANGQWAKGTYATKAQTQGVGKVTAVTNAIAPLYGRGPVAGFMDSTGDFNFCTEFENLKLVCCFNRASRKITDGGGLVSEIAMYQKNVLKDDLKSANAKGDTLYVLQGREENGLRGLRNSNLTMTYGATEEKLYKNADNEAQYQYIVENNMTIADAFNTFAIKTAADASVLGLKYGFLKEYHGYHSQKDADLAVLAPAA